MPQGRSVLVLGPTGAGKSSLLRKALKVLGSGAVALAPGMDEANSYANLLDNPAYKFKGFDDTMFYPSLKENVVGGLNELLRWQKEIFAEVQADVKEGKKPRYAVFGQDTATAMTTLAYNATLVKSGKDTPPAAMSPDGAYFYTLLKQNIDQIFHIPRALKGLGVHWIALGHVAERDTTEVTSAQVEGPKTKSIVPLIPGSYRDILPSFFDVVLHAGVSQGKHYLKWMPSAKRPTKSRFGSLGGVANLPNDWNAVMDAVDKAIEAENADK